MWGGNKDSITTDTVHIDTGASLYVIQMDVAILGNQENDTMLFTHLDYETLYHLNRCLFSH